MVLPLLFLYPNDNAGDTGQVTGIIIVVLIAISLVYQAPI